MSSLPKKRHYPPASGRVSASALAFGGAAPSSALSRAPRRATARPRSCSADPQVDNTDVYAFVAPDRPNRVTLIGNWIPFEDPAGGPNFYPFADDAHYNINIDNDGDAKADITYQWKFYVELPNGRRSCTTRDRSRRLHDQDLNFRQTYTLTQDHAASGNDGARARTCRSLRPTSATRRCPTTRASATTPIHTYSDGARRPSPGQADDPFFLDLRVFDLLYGADLSETGTDTLSGYNVNTIALQVPRGDADARSTTR